MDSGGLNGTREPRARGHRIGSGATNPDVITPSNSSNTDPRQGAASSPHRVLNRFKNGIPWSSL
jgi:hypothetical protein